mmetsp:Transcript_5907/g.9604  ORF Transcript_5907/g.9604 Transcript_5907/m.9604 type:complete len:156 (-) Transcript_5907:47-514(-)
MNSIVQKARVATLLQSNLNTQIVQVSSRPFLGKVFTALNFMHSSRDDIVTGGKFPNIPKTTPQRVELEEGKSYMWCSCGHSKNQPFCDKSHFTAPTSYRPLKFTHTKKTGKHFLCACKLSTHESGPYCDGTHSNIDFENLEKTYKVGFNSGKSEE